MWFLRITLLAWGNLLLVGSPSHAQRFRNRENARVANGQPSLPLDIIYDSTPSAAASTAGVTISVEGTTSNVISSIISSDTPTSLPTSHSAVSTTSSISSVLESTVPLSSSLSSHIVSTVVASTTSVSVVNPTASTSSAVATTTGLERRDAIPACLNSVELSCYNLAANCIDSVDWGNRNHIWSIQSCVAAATCYGVGDLITSVNCQTGYNLGNADEENLDYNIYAGIVGSCAWDPNGCPITQQNYVDFYYGTLTLINTGNWPSDPSVVNGYWSPILTWAATGTTIPYSNFNDWLHFSSFPTTPPTTTDPPPIVYTGVPWNPNPAPPPEAVSQTFVRSETTVVIAVPTVTVTVTVAGATITVAPGGTPVNGMVPTDVTQPGAVTPTFNYNPIPPATASSVTFVSGTWTSIVAVPTSTDEPVTVNGPPDDGDDDDSNAWWLLALGLLGPFLIGSIPASVAVIGGTTPAPTPPPDWPDPTDWVPPPPPPSSGNPDDPDDDDDDDDDDEPTVCFSVLPPYTLPYDGEGPEDVELLRRHLDFGEYKNISSRSTTHQLFKRSTRRITLGRCGDPYSFSDFNMGAANWFTLDPLGGPNPPSSSTALHVSGGMTHVVNDGKVKEHVFEFRFIRDFVDNQFVQGDCAWLSTNLWYAPQPDGRTTREHLRFAIDHTDNCVWVDEPINKAKSYVTNNHKPTAAHPPLEETIDDLDTLDPTAEGYQVEMLIRAFGMLGQYLNQNANALSSTATRIQNILALITPTTAIYPPLDARFNNYFRGLMTQYSNRITTRGVNMLDYYRNQINGVLQDLIINNPPGNPVPTVPQCWPVYHDPLIRNRLANGGVNWQNFVPPAIPRAPCNTAGETGSFILFYDTVTGQPITFVNDPQFQIAALGGSFFGLWRPTVPSIYYDVNLAAYYGPTCNGVHWMTRGATGQSDPSFRIATWDQDCTGGAGPGLSNLHVIDDNGNRMLCLFNNFNDGSNTFGIDCGPSQNVIQACIVHMNTVDGVANAYTSVPFMRFQ